MQCSCFIVARLLIPSPVELVTQSVVSSDVLHLNKREESVIHCETSLCDVPKAAVGRRMGCGLTQRPLVIGVSADMLRIKQKLAWKGLRCQCCVEYPEAAPPARSTRNL